VRHITFPLPWFGGGEKGENLLTTLEDARWIVPNELHDRTGQRSTSPRCQQRYRLLRSRSDTAPAWQDGHGRWTWCTWPEWIKAWGHVVGQPNVSYKQITVDEFHRAIPGGFGKEIGEMFEYTSDPGYDGGDPEARGLEKRKPCRLQLYSCPSVSCDGLTRIPQMGFEFPTTTPRRVFQAGKDFSQICRPDGKSGDKSA
jgi:hypothetical protein